MVFLEKKRKKTWNSITVPRVTTNNSAYVIKGLKSCRRGEKRRKKMSTMN
jgi:cytochrome c553